MKKIKYYIFCIQWLWKNRHWENTRQKFKAMERDFKNLKGAGNDVSKSGRSKR